MSSENKATSKCPFCNFDIPDNISATYIQYNCLIHGRYNLSDMFISEYKDCLEKDPLLLKRIARYLYETRDSSGFNLIDGYSNSLAIGHSRKESPNRVLLLDQAMSLYKTELSPIQKYEQTIYNLATRSNKFGQKFALETDRYIVPTMDDEEARAMLHALRDNGYVHLDTSHRYFKFTLTQQGLEQAEKLRRTAKSGPVVFVAAHFKDELKSARETIADTLKDLGYEPYLVDQDPHQDLIDLRIYDNVRQSRFVVADLTYNRQSVYYEAGFAHGLGLQVVLTCRADSFKDEDDDFKRVHFDLNHRNILVWEDEKVLKDKLEKHILQSFGRYVTSSK